jgi:hypothetical protein
MPMSPFSLVLEPLKMEIWNFFRECPRDILKYWTVDVVNLSKFLGCGSLSRAWLDIENLSCQAQMLVVKSVWSVR